MLQSKKYEGIKKELEEQYAKDGKGQVETKRTEEDFIFLLRADKEESVNEFYKKLREKIGWPNFYETKEIKNYFGYNTENVISAGMPTK